MVRLQPSGRRALHLFAHASHGRRIEPLTGEFVAPDDRVDVVDVHRAVDHLEQPRANLRLFAVADRLHEELPQRAGLEHFAKNVIDLAAERLSCRLQLLQQPLVHRALARLTRDQVPQVAHLRLPDAVDTAEALFQPVGVPRQVIVDHQMRAALQVDPFAGGIVGQQEADLRVVVEGGDGGAAAIARDAAVDDGDALRLSGAPANSASEILQGVACFSEDHDLAVHVTRGIVDQWVVEDAIELAPLGVLARAS